MQEAAFGRLFCACAAGCRQVALELQRWLRRCRMAKLPDIARRTALRSIRGPAAAVGAAAALLHCGQ
jgi:hypothetical protein